jgi:protein subunit release factor B
VRKFSKITINESELIEKFILGGGPGGQSVNKTRNRVQLTHIPSGLQVTCQRERFDEDPRARSLDFRVEILKQIEKLHDVSWEISWILN